MSMMKTNLTVIPMCPRERFALYKSSSKLILRYKKDWATLLHLCYTCYLLPVMNYLTIRLSVTDNISACRKYLAENRLSFPSAPRLTRLTLSVTVRIFSKRISVTGCKGPHFEYYFLGYTFFEHFFGYT